MRLCSHLMKMLAVTFVMLVTLNVAGQTPCKVGKNAPAFGFWTWAPEHTIKFYVIERDFDASELPYLLKPLQNWNAVAEATGSQVKFEYAGRTASPLYCDHCLTIMRGPVFDKSNRHATELKAYSARSNQILTWAHVVVDPALTNTQAISNSIAHELGHSVGLLDCYNCKPHSTVMNKLNDLNQPNDMEGPTACDIAQVKTAYKELTLRVRPAPVKIEITDEGDEPIDDDTPIVPKP